MTLTKTRAPKTRATKTKKPIGRTPIKDSEIAKATKLAQRKSGVTRRQLAKALRITESRASTVLTRVKKIKAAPLGPDAGKACRTLVFTLKKR
jgi:hypothetical protein